MGSLVSIAALKPVLQSSLPVCQPVLSLGLMVSSFPIAGPYIYLFKNLIRFLFAHLLGCQGPSKWQHNLLRYQLLLSLSYHLQHSFGFSARDFQKEYYQTMVELQKMKSQPLKAEGL